MFVLEKHKTLKSLAVLAIGVFHWGLPFTIRACHAAEPSDPKAWTYLDNGHIRLGVKTSSGAGIGYFAARGSKRNLLNHYDHGRLVQQSYYGNADGSDWNGKAWRWNPVQGGDYKGEAAKVLALEAKATQLYSKTQARHWAECRDIPEVIMEQWIEFYGALAHVRCRMTYHGTQRHEVADQETPAVFVNPELKTLLLYDGEHPWSGGKLSRAQPGWPGEQRRMTEGWAAYVDQHDAGLGVLVPDSDRLTCYRFGTGDDDVSACSYFAPLTRLAIEPELEFEYEYYLTAGSIAEIRERFGKIQSKRTSK